MVNIPDTWIVFGSAVGCEMVVGYKVDNLKRNEAIVRIQCWEEWELVQWEHERPHSLEEVCGERFEEVRK